MKLHAMFGALLCALVSLASPAVADETGRVGLYETASADHSGDVTQMMRRHRRCRHNCAEPGRVEHAGPMDIRTPTQLLAVAEPYNGSRRFTARARAWCADAMNFWLAKAGYHGTGDGRAISFARYGRPSGPKVGAIAVLRHHVGIVVGYSARGPVLLSGNHGHRVGVGVYSARRIIAYREPV